MRIMSNPQATMISLLCGVVLTASAAVAQTTSSDTSTPAKSPSSSVQSTQKQAKPSGTQSTQSDDFFQGLVALPIQSKTGFKPTVGDTVPHDMKLHPMPSKAATAMPGVKDHHVAKTDKNTAVIADPKTRKIMSVISSMDSTASTSGSTSTSSGTKASGTKTGSGTSSTTTNGSGKTNTKAGTTSTGSGSNGSK